MDIKRQTSYLLRL